MEFKKGRAKPLYYKKIIQNNLPNINKHHQNKYTYADNIEVTQKCN